MKYLKRLVLAAVAAVSLVLGGCANSHEFIEVEKRVEQAETAIDAGRRDLADIKRGMVTTTQLENRIKAIPVPAPQAPGMTASQVEAIAKKAAADAFAAGKVTDASTLATKTDVDAVVAKLSADIADMTPAAAAPAAPAPAKFAGVLENWPNWPNLAGAYLSNGYAGITPADRAAWLVELKAANSDKEFGRWVDSVVNK